MSFILPKPRTDLNYVQPKEAKMYLNNDQKRNIIEQRLTQFSAEKYQHELNLTFAQAMNDEGAIKTATDSIAVIEQAIAVHEAELNNLG